MKGIAKNSQEYVDQTGLKRWFGLDLEFDQDNKSPEEALAEVEEKVSKAIAKSNGFDHQSPELEYLNLGRMGAWPVVKDIQVKPEDREIGVSVESIMTCTDLTVLHTYKLLVRSDDKLREAYQKKEKELMNNPTQDKRNG